MAADARQRRLDRIYTLDEIQVIHVDRRMLDTDQHLACGRCWRFGKVGKLEDDSRLAESSDSRCTHLAPPVLVMAEFDEVATGERPPGLLQAATRRETAEIDRREAETLDERCHECGRFGMVPRDGGRGCTATKLGDFVDECIWTTPAAQDHFMAPGQRLSPECERDSAGANRSKFHAPLLSFEKSMRATPTRPARPTCASASAIRDGTERSATSNSAGVCASCSARATSALRWGGCRR